MTLSQLSHAVYDKHVRGRKVSPVQWIAWMFWARRSVGWMQTM